MSKKSSLLYKALGLIFLIAAAVIFAFWSDMKPGFAQLPKKQQPLIVTGTLFPQAKPLASFQLVSNAGAYSNAELKNKWTFLFFGFTHCKNICPTTMATLNRVYGLLKQQKTTVPNIVFVSVDPKRDTVPVVSKYVKSFNSHFIGITGSNTQISKLTKQIGIFFEQSHNEGQPKLKDYDLSHSGTIALVNPAGDVQALINMPHTPQIIAKDFKTIIHNYR